MKFYDIGNTHNSLGHYVLHLLGGITTTDYPLADIARATNTAKMNLAFKIWREQDDWDFDDKGNTSDFPIATTTLVNAQSDYSLPTDALQVRLVEIKDQNGDYYIIDKIDEKEVKEALDEFHETDGQPKYYRLEDGSIVLYPAPATGQVTMSAGIKMYYNRAVDQFTASTTTTEVGFGDLGDQIVAYEVAEEWAGINREDRLPRLQGKRGELEGNFLAHISSRSKEEAPNLKVNYQNNE